MIGPLTKRKWWISPIVLLLLLAITEGLFFLANPYKEAQPAAELYRNPNFKRGWPEYLRGKKEVGEKLSVLLSNSQGFGNEMADPADIYFAGFKHSMEAANEGWFMENWSMSGLRTSDLELLTIQAQVRQTDHLFLLLNFGNFDFEKNIQPDYPNTDVNLLFGTADFWPLTSQTLVAKNIDRDEILEKGLTLWSNTMRYRVPLYQQLSTYVPKEDEVFWFGNPVRRARHFNVQETPDFRRRISGEKKARESLSEEEIEQRLETFRKFIALFQRRLEIQPMEVTFLWSPLSEVYLDKKDLYYVSTFTIEATKMLRKAGFKVIDLTRVMEPEYFLSRGHFTKNGHSVFSKKLQLVLKNEL